MQVLYFSHPCYLLELNLNRTVANNATYQYKRDHFIQNEAKPAGICCLGCGDWRAVTLLKARIVLLWISS